MGYVMQSAPAQHSLTACLKIWAFLFARKSCEVSWCLLLAPATYGWHFKAWLETGLSLTCWSSWVPLVLAGAVKFNFMAWILRITLMFPGWIVSRGQGSSQKTEKIKHWQLKHDVYFVPFVWLGVPDGLTSASTIHGNFNFNKQREGE